jgi:hypothetical protein
VSTAIAGGTNLIGYANITNMASGSNVVTGPDGSVYVGNLSGDFYALHADGSPYWTAHLGFQYGGFHAAAVVAADGSVYAVTTRYASVTDHRRGGTGQYWRSDSWVHKFSAGGTLLSSRQLPLKYPGFAPFEGSGYAPAAPNLWSYNGGTVLMVSAMYSVPGGHETHLIALGSANLDVVADQTVTYQQDSLSTSSFFDCFLPGLCFAPLPYTPAFPEAGFPAPSLAIWNNPAGTPDASPWIWLPDWFGALVAYQFTGSGFIEIHRINMQPDISTPLGLPYSAAVGGYEAVSFEPSNTFAQNVGDISATPTQLSSGKLVTVSREGLVSLLDSTTVSAQFQTDGGSIASAAASCNYVYVAARNEFDTLNSSTLQPVMRLPWTEGGYYPPVIGPTGYVYGMTKYGLFVFAPPPPSRFGSLACRSIIIRPFAVQDSSARLQ